MGVHIPKSEESTDTSENATRQEEDKASTENSTDKVHVSDESSDKKDVVDALNEGMFVFHFLNIAS